MQTNNRVTIVQTAHHFLYLPVHYASYANWFGCVPDTYTIDILSAPGGTDRKAYELLKQGKCDNHNNICFAVADPAELLHDLDTHLDASRPVVLAGLITNSSFWAVDRRSHPVRFVRDLGAFDEIIAFADGTTSNGIAKRIYRDAKKTPSIRSVESGGELTALTGSKKGVMALTPDILGLDKLLTKHNGAYHVDLVLGKTPEYNNVLVTALLSRRKVVDEHPELVRGLLKAIQRATLLVRLAQPDVVKFASDHYNESEDSIKNALLRAEDSQVFPATIEVNQGAWEKAAQAAADAANRPYNDQEHDRVNAVYQSAVTPYQEITRKAIREDLLPRLQEGSRSEVNPRRPSRQLIEFAVFALTLGVLLGSALPPLFAVGVVSLTLAAYLTFRLPMNRWLYAFQIVTLVAGVGVLAWPALTKPETSNLVTVVVGWITLEATILLSAAAAPGVKR